MWWGYSQPLDIQEELVTEDNSVTEPLQVLLIGASDARHVIKTVASLHKHKDRHIKFHVIEPTLEQVARSILLLGTSLDETLGLQEGARCFLEFLGNILLKPASARNLVNQCTRLINIVCNSADCPWMSLEKLRHRDRDNLEWIFKFWRRAVCEGIPILDYWDRRVRKSLGARYDYKDGVFDWDFHMIKKPREISNLTHYEYKLWRSNGVAFTWLEGEPVRGNPTLLSNITSEGNGFIHNAYLGDIVNGPYYTWANSTSSSNKYKRLLRKLRASDFAEQEIMSAIHEIRFKKPISEELLRAHRDPSLVASTIVTEIPHSEIQQEPWFFKGERNSEAPRWTEISNIEVIFHPPCLMNNLKNRGELQDKFSLVWVAHNMTRHVSHLAPLLKTDGIMLVESRKYLVELRKEDLESFAEALKKDAQEAGLRHLEEINDEKEEYFRFIKS
ncbi:dynein assembly factor 3, axonemal [Orussus abietinus]|uniref:dynein assembly factor 3, axonemal n=1 Tax=Orussus abietinus TaxID=222816 RepID=UPI000C71626A|nr:dynein assembly factor 3, axonemal [Orussus abietinus]